MKVPSRWAHFYTFITLISFKAIYEVLEYGYHIVAESPTETANFLGMQGDLWDAQKDILMGIIGSMVALVSFRKITGSNENI